MLLNWEEQSIPLREEKSCREFLRNFDNMVIGRCGDGSAAGLDDLSGPS